MDIKNKLFRFRRAVRRNREEIARAFSITLTVILVVVLGYAAVTIYKTDRAMEDELNNVVIDENKIVIAPGWDYGEPGFHKVAENTRLTLEADYTTGEICVTDKESGKQWYSNPPARKEDNLALPGQINSQFYVKFLNVDKRTEIEHNNYTDSIKKGGMSYELVENGVKFTFAFPVANVYIPVQYTLCEDGFQAEILTSEIKGVGSKAFLVESINFLPFFGAGGLEDEGYLFVPDGSGALIDFNNGKQKSNFFTGQVYGSNITLPKDTADTVKERISMPVFGAKCNDSAFLGVILSGDTNCSITGTTSKKGSSYNRVWSTAFFREYRLQVYQATEQVGQEARVLSYSDDLMNGKNYAVRYFFLNGDDANYTGMSKRYSQFLTDSKLLKDSELADDKYLVLDLVGAVSIEKYVFGIKMPVVTALTTYNDVVTIVKELKEAGVDKLIINYVGALDSGLNNKSFSTVKTESVLGSKKEFQAMLNYLAEQNVKLFIETNPVDIYNSGHGYDHNRDAAKTFLNKYAFQYNYELDSLKATTDRWQLLHPKLIPDFVSSFVTSAESWNISNVSLDRMGEVLYTDYADDVPSTTRTHTLELWQQAMQTAVEKADYLLMSGGNTYTLPYADIVTDTAIGSSDYDMEDRSVPFYQIAFQDNTVLTPAPLNTTVDYTREFLKSLETGCSLKYNLVYGDISALVGTEYNTMVSYSYAYWKDIIVEQYHAMQNDTAQFAGQAIVDHQMVADDVFVTEYESGKLIINYGEETYTYEGNEIKSRDYIVISGGAK